MDIKKLSSKFVVKKLEDRDIQDILNLCCQNKLFYEYCPPFVTEESIRKDMLILPKNTKMEDKFYIGFYANERLIAVMDLISGYPEQNIAFIGFFMTDVVIQNRGTGSEIISEVCDSLKKMGYVSVRLVWVKGNPQSEHFWKKNKFEELMETTNNASYKVILAERIL